MPANFSWLEDGVIAGMARPMGSPNELQELREMGIEAIVSLTETPLIAPLMEEFGFEYKHLPIADFAPPTLDQIRDFVAFVNKMRSRSKPVAAHCGAGIGRTGAMLSCYLVSQGATSAEAIATVRLMRPGSVETLDQELKVHEYEREVRRAKRRKASKKKPKRKDRRKKKK